MLKHYDEDLFVLFRTVDAHFDESKWLQDHLRITYEEREQFLNNEIENPRFTYRAQTPQPNYGDKLDVLYAQFETSKAPEVVVDLYRKKLKKQLLRNALIAASLSGDDESFVSLSSSLYGKPHKRYFSYVAGRLLALCALHKSGEHAASAKRLKCVVGKISSNGSDIDVSVLPPIVQTGARITSVKEVVAIFQDTLDRCAVQGWEIQVDNTTHRTRFAVNVKERTIHIPAEAQLLGRAIPLTDVHVRALAEHEIGVHVRRIHEAQSQPLRLLEIGLDRYLGGEEGLAGYVQQQVEGATEFYGFDRYLAASFAYGMDGEKRDFRSVFSLMTDYYTLFFATSAATTSAPFRAAWDVCVRIFRGTTGQTAGCIFTKDIVYMEGNIELWHLLSERPHVFESLFVGKFNPLLSRHVRTLQTLEILKEW